MLLGEGAYAHAGNHEAGEDDRVQDVEARRLPVRAHQRWNGGGSNPAVILRQHETSVHLDGQAGALIGSDVSSGGIASSSPSCTAGGARALCVEHEDPDSRRQRSRPRFARPCREGHPCPCRPAAVRGGQHPRGLRAAGPHRVVDADADAADQTSSTCGLSRIGCHSTSQFSRCPPHATAFWCRRNSPPLRGVARRRRSRRPRPSGSSLERVVPRVARAAHGRPVLAVEADQHVGVVMAGDHKPTTDPEDGSERLAALRGGPTHGP